MKILLASSSPKIINIIKNSLNYISMDIAETGEEIFQYLGLFSYDCLIMEANLFDIWSISRFINTVIQSSTNKKTPIIVLKDEADKIPKLLCLDYGIKVIDLSEITIIDELIANYCIDKPSILIVEDDPNISKGMRITLETEYEVDICQSGQEGLKCWKEKRHDLVLLDLMLPELSGENVLSEIRGIYPHQSIVIISARSEVDTQQKLILLGANDYLSKPFSPDRLTKTCRVILTHALHQYELDLKENKLDGIAQEILLAIEALDNEETSTVMDILNDILFSMPDRMASEDLRLNRAIKKN